MGWDTPDIYGQPEHFGIQTIGEASWHDESWEFDFTVVWQSKEDPTLFYWARDSGCSCPSPFESFTSLEGDDYYTVNKGTKHDVIKDLLETLEAVKKNNDEYSWRTYDPSDRVLELVGKLVRL